MKHLLLLSCIFLAVCSAANSGAGTFPYISYLAAENTGSGKIIISGDTLIPGVLSNYVKMCEYEGGTAGWRIQIYNSSGREAREEANEIRTRFLNRYPDVKAYLVYQAPYFKIRVGDFRNKQEAFIMYKSIVLHFPVSYLVQDRISFPELDTPVADDRRRRR
jgi:hypothetical protein